VLVALDAEEMIKKKQLKYVVNDCVLLVVQPRKTGMNAASNCGTSIPLPRTIKVCGQVKKIGKDLLMLYFENSKCGGGPTDTVEIMPDGETAYVTFVSSDGMYILIVCKVRLFASCTESNFCVVL